MPEQTRRGGTGGREDGGDGKRERAGPQEEEEGEGEFFSTQCGMASGLRACAAIKQKGGSQNSRMGLCALSDTLPPFFFLHTPAFCAVKCESRRDLEPVSMSRDQHATFAISFFFHLRPRSLRHAPPPHHHDLVHRVGMGVDTAMHNASKTHSLQDPNALPTPHSLILKPSLPLTATPSCGGFDLGNPTREQTNCNNEL